MRGSYLKNFLSQMNHHEEFHDKPTTKRTIFYPNEKSKFHNDHLIRHRCSHAPKSSSNDQPLMILADGEVRHVSNVYRREKDFNYKIFPLNTNDDQQRSISDVPKTLLDRFCRSKFINKK